MATPIIITVAKQPYPAATYSIAPSLIPAGYTVAALMLDIATADFGNAATVISGKMEFSVDAGVTWVSGGSFGFQGGGTLGTNIGPGITVFREGIAGQTVRASLTLNRTVTVGGTLTIT